jgi:hypothetical protein
VNNELEMMWKEVVIAQFKAFSWGTEDNHEKPQIKAC